MNTSVKPLNRSIVILATLLSTLLATLLSSAHSYSSGIDSFELDLFDKERQRPVKLTVWHPMGKSCEDLTSRCLPNASEPYRIAVMSHGAMGSVRSMNWLAYPLASQGYIVVGINHYEESWVYGRDTIRPQAALKLWQRPLDISFALDHLSQNSPFQEKLAINDVLAVGFSSGGSSVLALAGAEYDYQQAIEHCRKVSNTDLSCRYTQQDLPELPRQAFQSLSDPRIDTVIALDPAAGHITTSASLKKAQANVLLFGLKNGDFLPAQYHASYYHEHLNNSQLYTFNGDEGHFIFQDSCQLEIAVHGIPLCKDKPSVDRKKSQAIAIQQIMIFLNSQN